MPQKKSLIVVFAGVMLIALGITLNAKVVAYLLTYDNVLDGPSNAIVWIFDLVLVLLGLWIIARRRYLADKFSITPKGLVYVFVCAIFILAGLEVAARIIDTLQGHKFAAEREVTADILPFRIFGQEYYVEKDGELFISSRHNEIYPLKKGDNTTRIVVFGGSTTQKTTKTRRVISNARGRDWFRLSVRFLKTKQLLKIPSGCS